MRSLIVRSYQNWKTTLVGIAGVLTVIADIATNGAQIFTDASQIVMSIGLLLAKDA